MRRKAAALVLVIVTVLLTACQIRVVQPPKAATTAPPATPASPTTTPSVSPPVPSAPIAPTRSPTADGKITKVGVYFGLADSHTIEVSIDGKPTALRLTDELKPQFEALKLKIDDKVEIVYQQNSAKQLVISEIRAVK